MEQDLIDDMPEHFRQLLANLPYTQAREVLLWVDHANDDNAVLETILEALNTAK